MTELTFGELLNASASVQSALDTLVREVNHFSTQINDVRPSLPGKAVAYQALLTETGQLRGRDLLYPYISSGLGNGALVELADGSVKWDLITGIGVHFFGHSDPALTATALRASLSDTVKHGNLLTGAEPTHFSRKLVELAKRHSKLEHCFLSTSGTLANENALKLALQKHAPACRVLAFADCFMGRSIVMSQIGDSAANRIGIPLNMHVDYIPFWDPALAERVGRKRAIDMTLWHLEQYVQRYPKQHACFIFELIQGEGGFRVGDRECFEELMKLCKHHNIAVWDDEIQCFGRTESMFAYEYFDLGDYVDLFCVGKMTQACATLYTPEYNPKPGLLSGTFTGETVSFAVGQAILERLDSGGYYGADGLFAEHFKAFENQVEALVARHPSWFPPPAGGLPICGGVGGMMRFAPFGGKKEAVIKACHSLFDAGVIAFWCGHDPYSIRFLPPLPALDVAEWPRIFERIEAGLAQATA